ncbi:hypothetical protein [Ramlibacter pallidus]|uniref:Lipoprotein n=1 Tax=Ramlibacter pallidus TaxID=2780087 RepID=A0ABR9S824_9BURK|nr:hypothetical protein [Ramlibacter pallidus]MBE7369633.1 hypothetical protein [Ramlibacter pallidus]
MIKILLPIAACAALAGCVGYGDPYGSYGYHGQPGVYASPGGYYPGPVYGGVYGSYPVYRTDVQRRDGRNRDRDGDGLRNRVDPDRDNDGVPNRQDARPNNPRRQ